MTSQLDLLDLLQVSNAVPAVKSYPCVGHETADQYRNECFPHIDTQWGSEEQMAADAERMASYRGMPINWVHGLCWNAINPAMVARRRQ
jgi:hypothetical protein